MTRLLPPLLFAAALACLFLGFAELRTAEGPVGQQSGWDRLLGRVPDLSAWATGEAVVEDVAREAAPEVVPPPEADESPADRARRLLREQRSGTSQDPVTASPDVLNEEPGVPMDPWTAVAVLCAVLGLVGAALRATWVPVASSALGIVGAGALAIGHWQWATQLAEQGSSALRIDAGVVEALPATGLWAAVGFLVAAAIAGLVPLVLHERPSATSPAPRPTSGPPPAAPPPRPVPHAAPVARPLPDPPKAPATSAPLREASGPSTSAGAPPPPAARTTVPSSEEAPRPASSAPLRESRPEGSSSARTSSSVPNPPRMDSPHAPHSTPPPHVASPLDLFTGFARPYFALIDGGALFRKPFRILYMVLAALNLLAILGVLAVMFKGGVGGILIGLFGIFGLWIGFQLWWDRKDRINTFVSPGSEFVALPVFAHFFQTCGEWFGTLMAIVGAGASLVMALLGRSGGHGRSPLDLFTAVAGDAPLVGLIASPLLGFLIIILTRAIAEQIRALVAVANNTKAIEVNTRKG
ncbi:MAG TPA: hypothetical protein PKE21_10695 [Flavobacteriales bacterium]|nr:hypothetical protein [Flavobacteriales bacterium]HMR27935.1 hypothetical protein [Flavobacteriales bacterium]